MKGFLIINKPSGITSFGVIKKIRNITKIKKIGHTGTLDPFAEGVLILCIGKATRLCSYFLSDTKEYLATIKMGIKTDTLDIEGDIIETQEITTINESILNKAKEKMLLLQSHIPPKYSAKKINGKRAYNMARKNEDFKLSSTPIKIFNFEIVDYTNSTITYKTKVSKGTYIRVLSEIFAKFTNNIATTIKLKRIKSGEIDINKAISLDKITSENWTKQLIPIEKIFDSMEKIYINNSKVLNFKNGKNFSVESKNDIINIMVCNNNGECVGFANIKSGILNPKMVLI